MASHFLDSDERASLVETARACIEANLSVRGARSVWRYDVSRAVGYNLWSVAGEWARFDDDWLLARVQRLRARWDNRPGTGRWLRYWIRSRGTVDSDWQAIARIMTLLWAERDAAARAQLGADLHALSQAYFGSAELVDSFALHAAADRARLSHLYHAHFQALMAPVVGPHEAKRMHAQALAVFGESGAKREAERGTDEASEA